MKPLSLNLSQMKKIAGDDKTSTFLHPSGHKMVIAHSGVSALHRKQLESLPVQKLADGGPASNHTASEEIHPLDAADQAASQEAYDQSMASLPTSPDQQTDQDPVAAAPSDLQQPNQPDQSIPDQTQEQPAQAQTNSAPISSDQIPPASPNFVDAYQQGQRAISEQQKIDTAKAKADQDVVAQDLVNRQSLNQGFQDNYKTFMDHQQQFMKDYMNQHIDPNHYRENMSTGQKISTGIGLLLGGMASARTGVNPAMEFLNKQIDRDMKAQESRIDQQKTLLGANQELYHDQVVAMNQTRVNMNDIMDHKIQLEALKLGTPQAKANADAAHAKFALENQNLLQQSALRSSVMQRLQQGGQGLNALDLGKAGFIPQEQAIKEQASIESQKKALASATEIFQKYKQEQTPGNLLNPQSYRRADELNAQLTNLIMESDASKRLTPESAKLEVKPFWVSTGDSAKTVQDKLAGIGNLIRQHSAPTPYMSQLAPQSLPKYNQALGNSLEGKVAVNPKTGERIINQNGKWVPLAK